MFQMEGWAWVCPWWSGSGEEASKAGIEGQTARSEDRTGNQGRFCRSLWTTGLGLCIFWVKESSRSIGMAGSALLTPSPTVTMQNLPKSIIGKTTLRTHHQTLAVDPYGCSCVMSHVPALLLFKGRCFTVYLQKKKCSLKYPTKKYNSNSCYHICHQCTNFYNCLINRVLQSLSRSLGFLSSWPRTPGPVLYLWRAACPIASHKD